MDNKFNAFKNKTVLVTGNTGFKGAWLTSWLLNHEAKLIGFSNDIPTNPSLFKEANLENKIKHIWGDVRNFNEINNVITTFKPDYVFHLAAQPIVRTSYTEPAYTFETNMGGTLNMLESLRLSNHKCTAVFITSDKCYDNVEQLWGYRETDKLGGKDPYSGSKGAAELVIRSYSESFFKKPNSNVRVAVGRAGNVIGGGDWADSRIVPDAIRAWKDKQPVEIRSPYATRPWQLVLEPLSGYLNLAYRLFEDDDLNGEAFNFGPSADQNINVAQLLNEMILHWTGSEWVDLSSSENVYEAGLLKLSCDKALHILNWKAVLTFSETIRMTCGWYLNYYKVESDYQKSIWDFTLTQINEFESLAVKRGLEWTKI